MPRPSRRRQVWLWVRWLGSLLIFALLARLLLAVVAPALAPGVVGWVGAVLLGLVAVFMLLPMPTEHLWDDE